MKNVRILLISLYGLVAGFVLCVFSMPQSAPIDTRALIIAVLIFVAGLLGIGLVMKRWLHHKNR